MLFGALGALRLISLAKASSTEEKFYDILSAPTCLDFKECITFINYLFFFLHPHSSVITLLLRASIRFSFFLVRAIEMCFVLLQAPASKRKHHQKIIINMKTERS